MQRGQPQHRGRLPSSVRLTAHLPNTVLLFKLEDVLFGTTVSVVKLRTDGRRDAAVPVPIPAVPDTANGSPSRTSTPAFRSSARSTSGSTTPTGWIPTLASGLLRNTSSGDPRESVAGRFFTVEDLRVCSRLTVSVGMVAGLDATRVTATSAGDPIEDHCDSQDAERESDNAGN